MICIQDYEDFALRNLSKIAADYYKSGANEEVTLRSNRNSFSLYIIRPRFLNRDVSVRDLSTSFLDLKVAFPIGVAPTGLSMEVTSDHHDSKLFLTAMQKMAHPMGELATAKGNLSCY